MPQLSLGHDIRALGYVRIRATDLTAWRTFAYETIGFAEGTGPESEAVYLRMDERHARMVIVPSEVDEVESVGWEVADGMGLSRVRSAVEDAGVGVKDLTDEQCEVRRVEAGIAFEAPGRTPVEVFHGSRLDHSPVATPYAHRFVTGALGMGHVVVPVADTDASFAFHREVLGFRSRGAFAFPGGEEGTTRIRFMGVNPRHHSLAIMPSPRLHAPALVHIMVEMETLDEVGRALDRVMRAGYHLSSTLGRHTNDKMVSFYVRTPGGWDLEVGCEGYLVDDDTYSAEEISADSYWGHQWDFSR